MGKLRCFLGTLAIGAQRAAQQDQGQRSGAPAASLGGIRRCGYTRDPWPDPAAGESPFSLGQVLPGHSPDIDADAAVWGRAKAQGRRNPVPCHGAAMGQSLPRRDGHPGEEVKRCCRTILLQGPRYSPNPLARFLAPGERTSHPGFSQDDCKVLICHPERKRRVSAA